MRSEASKIELCNQSINQSEPFLCCSYYFFHLTYIVVTFAPTFGSIHINGCNTVRCLSSCCARPPNAEPTLPRSPYTATQLTLPFHAFACLASVQPLHGPYNYLSIQAMLSLGHSCRSPWHNNRIDFKAIKYPCLLIPSAALQGTSKVFLAISGAILTRSILNIRPSSAARQQ